MNKIAINKHLLLGVIIGALIVYGLSSFTTERKLNELQIALEEAIAIESNKANNLALQVSSGEISSEIVKIIPDCSAEERLLFETKLGQLDSGLGKSDLAIIDTLFSRCAPVSALRKTLMVMNLKSSVFELNDTIEQRKTLGEFAINNELIAAVNRLAELEGERAQYSLELVYIQREIVDLLMSGERSDSASLQVLKDMGLELRNRISQLSEEAKSYREMLKTS